MKMFGLGLLTILALQYTIEPPAPKVDYFTYLWAWGIEGIEIVQHENKGQDHEFYVITVLRTDGSFVKVEPTGEVWTSGHFYSPDRREGQFEQH